MTERYTLPFGVDRSYGAGTTFAVVLAWHHLDRMSCPWTDLVLMPNGVMCDTCGWRAVDEDLLQPVVGTTDAETSREIPFVTKAERHIVHYRTCGCLGSGSVCCDPSCCHPRECCCGDCGGIPYV